MRDTVDDINPELPKLGDCGYLPYYGYCRIYIINRSFWASGLVPGSVAYENLRRRCFSSFGSLKRIEVTAKLFMSADTAFGPQHCEAMQSRRQAAKDAVLPSATPRVKKGRINPKAKPATVQSSLKASPKSGGSCDGKPEEEDKDPKDAGHIAPKKRLQPHDLLFSEEEATAESSNSFAGLTIGDLMNQEPVWKIPDIYRHDQIVDTIPGTDSSDSGDEAESDGKINRDLDKMSVKDDSQKELEALQIATIVGLVDNFEVEIGGRKLTRKLLFLSNKQARMLPLNNLDKVMSGLDFYPRPKLVIQMCFSAAGGKYQYNPLTLIQHHWSELAGEEVNGQHYFVSEENGLNGARDTEYKIQTFLKDCVIPVARQHKALVIVGQNDCSLSAVFGRLCEEEAERRRGQLGFYVLSFVQAPNVLEASHNPDSVAYQLRKSSKNWRSASDRMWYVLKKDRGAEAVNYYPYLDAPPGCRVAVKEFQPN